MRFRVRVTGGFWLILLWFAAVNGWEMLAVVLSAAAIHEAGHCLLLKLFGAGLVGLELTQFGAVLKTTVNGLSYGKEILAALAGPAANFAAACAAVLLRRPGWDVFAGINIVLCAFNLLPICPLDGGSVLSLLVTWGFGPEKGDRVSRWAGGIAAVCLAGSLGYVMWRTKGSLWLLMPLIGTAAAMKQICCKKKHIL